MSNMALDYVGVRVLHGARTLLLNGDFDLNASLISHELLRSALKKSDHVLSTDLEALLLEPVTITLHLTAQRTAETAMAVSSMDTRVQTRCHNDQQQCVLFRIHRVQEASNHTQTAAGAERPKLMFGSCEC